MNKRIFFVALMLYLATLTACTSANHTSIDVDTECGIVGTWKIINSDEPAFDTLTLTIDETTVTMIVQDVKVGTVTYIRTGNTSWTDEHSRFSFELNGDTLYMYTNDAHSIALNKV